MVDDLAHSLQRLCTWFKKQDRVVIAYSGGVDSALLLYVATRVLGREGCRGFFADSCLIGTDAKKSAIAFAGEHHLTLETCPVEPLQYPHFSQNSGSRCYICKKQTYRLFLSRLDLGEILVDGTNLDDLNADRPGTQALEELKVATPYLECKISKYGIRALSYHLGLSTWCKLSDSCLATRVTQGSPLNLKILLEIDTLESALHLMGFAGCRVQVRNRDLFLTLHTSQIEQILVNDMLKQVQDLATRYNFGKVFLDLFEREGILPSLLDYIGFEGDSAPQKRFQSHFNNMSG